MPRWSDTGSMINYHRRQSYSDRSFLILLGSLFGPVHVVEFCYFMLTCLSLSACQSPSSVTCGMYLPLLVVAGEEEEGGGTVVADSELSTDVALHSSPESEGESVDSLTCKTMLFSYLTLVHSWLF